MKRIIGIFLLAVLLATGCARPAKNVVWLIGDGMGPGTMGFFMQGVHHVQLPQYPDKRSTLEKFINASVSGFYFDNTYDTIVTDSSCAATQMAGGKLSRPDFIGIDHQRKPVETLLEEAYKQGKSIGVISDAYVADATPAGFLAHTSSRHNKYDIARQLVNSQAQIILGGGKKYFTQHENQKLLEEARQRGWTVVSSKEELAAAKQGRILGLFAEEAMPFYGDMEQHPHAPTLLEMTQKAIEILSQNKKGYVLMVEAGKVDWALHDNEMGPTLWEMMNLDETLAYVWQKAQQDQDTLVYVNADHETGVPVFDYRHLDADSVQQKTTQGEVLYSGDMDYVNYPYFQRLFAHKHLLYYVYPAFRGLPAEQQTAEKLQEMVDQATGMHTDLKLNGQIPSYEELVAKMNQAQAMKWATKSHSSGMLLGVAYGPGAQRFGGVYHNTDIKGKMEKALGFASK